MDQISALLRRAMPFQTVSDELLRDIAKLAHAQSYARGDMIYDLGDEADDIYIVSSGSVQHVLQAGVDGASVERVMGSGDVFGWAAVFEGARVRLAKTVSLERTDVIRINGEELIELIRRSPVNGDVIISRFATMITREFSAPDAVAARLPHLTSAAQPAAVQGAGVASGWALTSFRIAQWIKSPKPYLMLAGFAILLGHTAATWRTCLAAARNTKMRSKKAPSLFSSPTRSRSKAMPRAMSPGCGACGWNSANRMPAGDANLGRWPVRSTSCRSRLCYRPMDSIRCRFRPAASWPELR